MGGRPRTRASSSIADKQRRQSAVQQTRSSVEQLNVNATHSKSTASAETCKARVSNAGGSHVPEGGPPAASKNQPEGKKTPKVSPGRRRVVKNINASVSGKSPDKDQDHVTLSLKINRKKNCDAVASQSNTDEVEVQPADRPVTERDRSQSNDRRPVSVSVSVVQPRSSQSETEKSSHDDGDEKKTIKSLSFSPTSAMDVTLPVTCGSNVARLFLNRLETGSRGLCVKLPDGKWMTPNEFQAVSGRGNAKDWKRSIRHHDRSLKLLEKTGLLSLFTPPICLCEHCDVQVGDDDNDIHK